MNNLNDNEMREFDFKKFMGGAKKDDSDDEFDIKPQDIIRIGSINDPSPEYYTVLTSSIEPNKSISFVPFKSVSTFTISPTANTV